MKFNLSSLTNYLKLLRYGNRLRPERDWLVLVGVTFILFVASIGWNVWLFLELENGENIGSSPAATHPVTPSVSVTGVQQVFQTRANQEANYANSYHFVDPSVPGS